MTDLKLYPEHTVFEKTMAILQPTQNFAIHISKFAKHFKEYIESELDKGNSIDGQLDEHTLPAWYWDILHDILPEYETNIKPEVLKSAST